MGESGSGGVRVSGDGDNAGASDFDKDGGEEGSFGFALLFSAMLLLAFVVSELVVGTSCTPPCWGRFLAVGFFTTFLSLAVCVAFFVGVGGCKFLASVSPLLFRSGFVHFINNGLLLVKALWVLMSSRWSCFGAPWSSQALLVCFHAYLVLLFNVSSMWAFLVVHILGCPIVGFFVFASLLMVLPLLSQYLWLFRGLSIKVVLSSFEVEMASFRDNLFPIEVEPDTAVDVGRWWWGADGALFCGWIGTVTSFRVIFSPFVPIEVVILEGPSFSVLVFFKVKVLGAFLEPMWVSFAPLLRSHGSLFEVICSPMEVEWLHGFWVEGLLMLLLFVLLVEGSKPS
ncbi:hypothetical protein SUGI_0709780 [Cryptomeria japonica]|nr:hypothetical protein SUGI_0709780 [Cryptomeria japonica]